MVCATPLRIRPAKSSDRGFFFEVRRAGFRTYVEETSGWDDAEQRTSADREFDELPIAIVEEDGRSVGYLCVVHKDEYDFIDEIAVLPEAQGRGIGTQLLRDILQSAQRRGVPVRLSVFAGNPARALYARLGFHVTRIDLPRIAMEWKPSERSPSGSALGAEGLDQLADRGTVEHRG
ncbi:N-acetyltransferase family protein [Actinopolymorpha pittospori]